MLPKLSDWDIIKIVSDEGEKLIKGAGRVHKPKFAEGRKDICVVKYSFVDARGAYEVIFFVYKDPIENRVYCIRVENLDAELLVDSRKDIVDVADIKLSNGHISIKIVSGGTLSKKGPWETTIQFPVAGMEC